MNFRNTLTASRNLFAAAALLVSGAAGATVVAPPPADLTSWGIGNTINDCGGGGDCDMSWTLTNFGGTLAIGATGLSIAEIDLAGTDTYTIAFDFSKADPVHGGIVGVNNFFIDYTMFVSAGPEHFVNVSLDSTVPASFPGVVVTKAISDCAGAPLTTLTSNAGNPAGPNGLSGTCIAVHETFAVAANGLITNATNTYTVGSVPEPGSLALLAIGLMSLGLVRRRG